MKKRAFSTGVSICIVLIGMVFVTLQPNSAVARDPYNIELYTIPAGYPAYSISVGVAAILNKKSEWLKATALEGRGPIVALKEIEKNKKRRPHFFFFMQPKWIWAAMDKKGPFKKSNYDYDSNVKYVAVLGANSTFLMTVNPAIKTTKDLKDKKVQMDSMRGGARQIVYEDLFRTEGILDTIKFQYGRAPAAVNALRDGLLDVVNGGADLVGLPNEWRVAPFMTELMATKPVYFLDTPKVWFDDYVKRTGYPDFYVEIPPKMLGPTQPKKLGFVVNTSCWAVHKDMPDDVVYEFCKYLYQDIEKLVGYTPLAAVLSKKTMAAMSVPESKIHPAALKFYKEMGIPIGGFFD